MSHWSHRRRPTARCRTGKHTGAPPVLAHNPCVPSPQGDARTCERSRAHGGASGPASLLYSLPAGSKAPTQYTGRVLRTGAVPAAEWGPRRRGRAVRACWPPTFFTLVYIIIRQPAVIPNTLWDRTWTRTAAPRCSAALLDGASMAPDGRVGGGWCSLGRLQAREPLPAAGVESSIWNRGRSGGRRGATRFWCGRTVERRAGLRGCSAARRRWLRLTLLLLLPNGVGRPPCALPSEAKGSSRVVTESVLGWGVQG